MSHTTSWDTTTPLGSAAPKPNEQIYLVRPSKARNVLHASLCAHSSLSRCGVAVSEADAYYGDEAPSSPAPSPPPSPQIAALASGSASASYYSPLPLPTPTPTPAPPPPPPPLPPPVVAIHHFSVFSPPPSPAPVPSAPQVAAASCALDSHVGVWLNANIDAAASASANADAHDEDVTWRQDQHFVRPGDGPCSTVSAPLSPGHPPSSPFAPVPPSPAPLLPPPPLPLAHLEQQLPLLDVVDSSVPYRPPSPKPPFFPPPLALCSASVPTTYLAPQPIEQFVPSLEFLLPIPVLPPAPTVELPSVLTPPPTVAPSVIDSTGSLSPPETSVCATSQTPQDSTPPPLPISCAAKETPTAASPTHNVYSPSSPLQSHTSISPPPQPQLSPLSQPETPPSSPQSKPTISNNSPPAQSPRDKQPLPASPSPTTGIPHTGLLHEYWNATVAGRPPKKTNVTHPGHPTHVPRGIKYVKPHFFRIETTTWISAVHLGMYSSGLGPHLAVAWNGIELFKEDDHMGFVIAELADCIRVFDFYCDEVSDCLQIKLISLPSKHFFVSVVFTVLTQGQGKICTLTILARKEFQSRYLDFHPRAIDRLGVTACRLCILLSKDSPIPPMNEEVQRLCECMEVLLHHHLPESISCFPELCKVTDTYGAAFFSIAVTSHLKTMGCTVVIGSDKDKINLFVTTLAVFSDAIQRLNSSHLCDLTYSSDLMLQGVNGVITDVTDEQLFLSPYPTSIVDLDARTVSMFSGFYSFKKLQKDYIQLQVDKLYCQSASTSVSKTSKRSFILRHLHPTSNSELVSSMLEELQDLPRHLQGAVVRNWLHLFVRYATTAVLILEKTASGTSSDKILRNLSDALSLHYSDLDVILAFAEKISPGFHEKMHASD
ncbi:guanine nucleotide exchange protein C9orf72 [Pelomyxa schiedti]|nr:guanine nucleotide exchange protein C9orf72 [Pelomyxa schiedti]